MNSAFLKNRVQFCKKNVLKGTVFSILLLANFNKSDIPSALLILTTADTSHPECGLPVAYFHFFLLWWKGSASCRTQLFQGTADSTSKAEGEECDLLCTLIKCRGTSMM